MFGNDVLRLVVDQSEDKTKTWKERKQITIDRLGCANSDFVLICFADKLSNLRSMAADKSLIGDKLWERFNTSKGDIEWYYREIDGLVYYLGVGKMYTEYSDLMNEVFGE